MLRAAVTPVDHGRVNWTGCKYGGKWYEYFLIVFEFDPIWKKFYLYISDSEYAIFIIDSYLNVPKLHFYNIDIYYNFI